MQTEKADVEQLIRDGHSVQIHPEGYSMYPMLVPGRDEAVIARADTAKLRRGDVILYRRESGRLVLHRIVRRDAHGFYTVGDNRTDVEGPLAEEQVRGLLVAFVRKGKRIAASNPLYAALSRLWLLLLPFRGGIFRLWRWVKRLGT